MIATSKLHPYLQLMRLDKPVGLVLLAWPCLWGLWLAAEGMPPLAMLCSFMLGVLLMRSAGCVINDIADRNFDGHVARTARRPLAAGTLSVKQALSLAATLITLAAAILLQYNWLTWAYAGLALLIAMLYPFCKRFINCPQVVLGIAFSASIPMAFAALHNHVPAIGWQLFIAASLWPVAYDTYYALADKADDLKIGIKSTAIWWGRVDLPMIILLQSSMLGLLAHIGWQRQAATSYYLALLAAAGFASYQCWLARTRQPQACFHAFLNNQWLGLCVFLAFLSL